MRTKNTMKTFVYGIIFTSIIALLGLIKTKVLLTYLGSEYVGVYQLFSQMYVYLSLVDGGIGASIAYQLYKPIQEKDEDKINKIIAGARYYFKIVGIIVIVIGIFLSLGIMFFIKETTISAWYIKICFILFVASSACSYFTSSHAILYEAEQKLYKSSNLNHLLSICESIIAIVISMLGGKLLTILSVFLLLSIVKNIILFLNSKRDHKYLKKEKEKDLSFKKDANNLIINKINTLIFENIDIIIVSKYLGLTKVFIYTCYNQIISMITQMVQRLNSALLPSVGNLLVTDNKKAKNIFYELNSLLFFIGSLLFVPLFYMLSPFIGIFYGKEYTVSNVICLLFVTILYINILKIALESYIKASGEFKSVRNCAIYQSIVNLTLSLILVKKYGIGGVLIATIFAFITGSFVSYPKIISRKIINDKTINYYKKCLKYILGLFINMFICYYFNKLLINSNLIMWIINGILMFIVNFIMTTIYYYLTKELLFLERLKVLLKDILSRRKNAKVK